MERNALGLRRLAEGTSWRWHLLRRYWFLLTRFRNGTELVRRFRRGQPCDFVVLRDGVRLLHPPGRGGLVETLLELWHEEVYTSGGFYRPAPGDVVIDVGANVGLFAIWLARQSPDCRVVALEPFAENFAFLESNLKEAGARSATAYQTALGGSAGQGYMVAGGDRSLDHKLSAEPGPGECRPVPTVTLQGLLELAGADRVALLKMDIEGMEYEVFLHSDVETLGRFDRIAIEYHDNLRPGTLQFLRDTLQATHHLTMGSMDDRGYGILRACARR